MAMSNLRAKPAPDKLYPNAKHPDEVHPDDCPEVYASFCKGNCLEPVYRDGCCLVFSKVETPEPGDYVGIWLHPDVLEPDGLPRRVKRLVSMWPGITFPYKASPASEVMPLVMMEQLNPPRILQIPASHILAMHKVVGEAESRGNGMARYRPAKREAI